jgi:hypothetical protein
MKKLLSVLLALVLTLSLAAAAMAQIETTINGEVAAGYFNLPGWGGFDKGAFLGQYRWFNARFTKQVSPRDDVVAGVVFQIEYYNADLGADFSSPVQNFYVIYDPGFVKLTFDAKGRDVVLGATEDMLKLNIARRYGLYGEPHVYRVGDTLAKQLTVDVPLGDLGSATAVIGLEPLSDGSMLEFVGALAKFNIGPGIVGIGYQTEMNDASYTNPTPSFFVLATDFDITDSIRLRVDYNSRNDDGNSPSFRPVDIIEDYAGTPFVITNHINSIVTINGVHEVKARIMDTKANDIKYWIGGSYKFNDTPYRVGLAYRNFGFNGKDKFDGDANDASIIELSGTYDAGPEITAFYRTDGSFGFICEIGFW